MKIRWVVFKVFFVSESFNFSVSICSFWFLLLLWETLLSSMNSFMKIVFIQVWKRKYFAWARNTIPGAAFFLEVFVSLSVNFIAFDMNPQSVIITFNSFVIFHCRVITYFTWKFCWHIFQLFLLKVGEV